MVVGLQEAYSLGILSSVFHVVWAIRAGSRLGVGNDTVYVKCRCFDPFPFRDATDAQKAAIGASAEELDAHRKRVLVALNKERAKEEKRGLVRCLRPDYQIPRFGSEKEKHEQLEADLGEAMQAEAAGPKPGFPSDERDQTPAVLHQLMAAEGFVDAETIATSLKQSRKCLAPVQAVLAALYRMGLVSTSDGKSFAFRRAA